jgi:hypothetical protein
MSELANKLTVMVATCKAIRTATPEITSIWWEIIDINLEEMRAAKLKYKLSDDSFTFQKNRGRMRLQLGSGTFPGITCFVYSEPVAVQTHYVVSAVKVNI